MSLARYWAVILAALGALLVSPALARADVRPSAHADDGRLAHRGSDGARTSIVPYIELGQVVVAELSPGDDVLTYTSLAVGVDATIAGRNTAGQVSLRYERRIGWGSKQSDGDVISGLARVSSDLIPRVLRLDAGALATRASVENGGGASLNSAFRADRSSRIYSLYAGPTLSTNVGNVAVGGSYRVGYTRVEALGSAREGGGAQRIDLFDDSVAQAAAISAGIRPGVIAPVGVTLSAGWNREDISNLDQRVDARSVRADFILPVSLDTALLGGIGHEDVEISSRDALRDAAGDPVIGRDGRFVTDKSGPRRLAYDVEGLTWDAGVMWRPSRRTALEAHVGRRYGSTSFYGSFGYNPNQRMSLHISAYDNIAGFGGQVQRSLEALPTEFTVSRNGLNGDIGGCVIARSDGSCLNSALSSVASATFRARGIAASWAVDLVRLQYGLGIGYDRRRFIAAPGTVLAAANGVVDENIWAQAYVSGRIDHRSAFRGNLYASLYKSGFAGTGDATAIGANASYFRNLTDRLTATAAIGLDGIDRELVDDQWAASALLGLRYSL